MKGLMTGQAIPHHRGVMIPTGVMTNQVIHHLAGMSHHREAGVLLLRLKAEIIPHPEVILLREAAHVHRAEDK